MRLAEKWLANLEFFEANKLYNIISLIYVLDAYLNLLEYRFVYRFGYVHRINKDLFILSNISNSHLNLLFTIKYKVIKNKDKDNNKFVQI